LPDTFETTCRWDGRKLVPRTRRWWWCRHDRHNYGHKSFFCGSFCMWTFSLLLYGPYWLPFPPIWSDQVYDCTA
jgi:hypothetical protein